MKNRPRSKIYSLIAMCLVTLTTFTVAFTAAAFTAAERHQQNITVDLGYKKYFGTGTKIDPTTHQEVPAQSGELIDGKYKYFISTSDHLRNLSTLVNMGAFDENDEFELNPTNNILNYTGAPLTPIGNDQFPFRSYFHGKDLSEKHDMTGNLVPIISNLIIEGKNLADVGMFGYIANSGRIGNFLLEKPLIKTTYVKNPNSLLVSNTYDFKYVDDNPFRYAKDENGGYAFDTNNCEKIDLIPTETVKNDPKRITKFKIESKDQANPINLTYKLGNDSVTATPYFEISNPKLLTYDSTTGIFSVNTTASNPPKVGNQVQYGEYMTVDYSIKGIVPFGSEFRYCEMTIERFKLYYEYSSHAIVNDETDFRTLEKMIYPTPYILEGDSDTSGEDFNAQYTEYDDIRSLYVGVVAGRIDGIAERIGVNYPVFDLHRPFISYSLLFGKAIDDTAKRVISIENYDSTKDFLPNQTQLTFRFIPRRMYNYYKTQKLLMGNADTLINNRYLTNIYKGETMADNEVTTSGFDKEAQNIIRFYANHGPQEGLTKLPESTEGNLANSSNTSNDSIQLRSMNIRKNGVEYKNVKAINIVEPMNVNIPSYELSTTAEKPYDIGFHKLSIENCLQLWATAKHNKSKVTMQTGENLSFYIDLEIDYVYFDESSNPRSLDCRVINKSMSGRRLKFTKARGKNNPYKNNTHYAFPRNVDPNSTPKPNLPLERMPDSSNTPIYKPDKFNDDSPYRYGVLNDVDGKTGYGNLIMDQVSGATFNPNATYDVHTKKISISTNEQYTHKASSTGNVLVEDKVPFGFFPCVFIGIEQPQQGDNSAFSLNIVGMRVTLSNKKGNASNTTGTVDFTVGTKLQLGTATGVKLQARTIHNAQISATETNATPTHFAYVDTNAIVNNGHTSFIIHVKRDSSHKVTIDYDLGNQSKDVSNSPEDPFYFFLPFNTSGTNDPTVNFKDGLAPSHTLMA